MKISNLFLVTFALGGLFAAREGLAQEVTEKAPFVREGVPVRSTTFKLVAKVLRVVDEVVYVSEVDLDEARRTLRSLPRSKLAAQKAGRPIYLDASLRTAAVKNLVGTFVQLKVYMDRAGYFFATAVEEAPAGSMKVFK